MESPLPRIEILSEQIDFRFVSKWYDLADESHFWMQWRFFIFFETLKKLPLPTLENRHGLEVGCGHGVVRRQLEHASAWTLDGTDIDMEALKQNHPGRGRTYYYNIFDRLPSLKERYDFIVLFDVLEHIAQPKEFLESCLYHLKPGGYMFINVPALQILYGPYDKAAGHIRRYNKKSLETALLSAGTHIIDIRYWGLTLLPLLLLRNALTTFNSSADETIKKGFNPPNKLIHAFLKQIMRAETFLLRRPCLGTSVFAVSAKK